MELTKRQRAFALIVAAEPGLSHAEAARRAGYADSGAKVVGCRLAQDPRVIAEIRKVRGEPAVRVASGVVVGPIEPVPVTPAGRRDWLLDIMFELAEQRDNLSVAYKAAEWLGRTYRVGTKLAEIEDASPGGDELDGMDLDKARRIREAARVA
jgi:hypothetical protein